MSCLRRVAGAGLVGALTAGAAVVTASPAQAYCYDFNCVPRHEDTVDRANSYAGPVHGVATTAEAAVATGYQAASEARDEVERSPERRAAATVAEAARESVAAAVQPAYDSYATAYAVVTGHVPASCLSMTWHWQNVWGPKAQCESDVESDLAPVPALGDARRTADAVTRAVGDARASAAETGYAIAARVAPQNCVDVVRERDLGPQRRQCEDDLWDQHLDEHSPIW